MNLLKKTVARIAHHFPGYRFLRRSLGFFCWSAYTLGSFFRKGDNPQKSLLLVYDLSTQPFSVGDSLLLHEASLVIREERDCDRIDLAIVFDQNSPGSGAKEFSTLNSENIFFHLQTILGLAQTNQFLGSLFVFNSHAQFHEFVSDNFQRYSVWPDAMTYYSREYLYYYVFNDVLFQFYQQHRRLPYLSCRAFLRDWAKVFFAKHLSGTVPVTVNLRNNKLFHTHRNCDIEAWVSFFNSCKSKYPVTFIIIGSLSEIDARFRSCSNVILAKDFLTTVEQDLALIQSSAIHMGSDSGPVIVAIFGKKPYLVVNTVVTTDYFARPEILIEGDDHLRFWFSQPFQKYMFGRETCDMLLREFSQMWEHIDIEKVKADQYSSQTSETQGQSWLR